MRLPRRSMLNQLVAGTDPGYSDRCENFQRVHRQVTTPKRPSCHESKPESVDGTRVKGMDRTRVTPKRISCTSDVRRLADTESNDETRTLKVLVHMGGDRPWFELRDRDEMYLKVICDNIDVHSPKESDRISLSPRSVRRATSATSRRAAKDHAMI